MKLHRTIEHNAKVCSAQELGSFAQGQDHNQVRGQIAPKIRSECNLKTTQANLKTLHGKIKHS